METNSSSNKMGHRRKKRAGQLDVRPYFFWYARWLKNSLVVRQVNIPFYEVDAMFQGQPAVQVEVVLQVAEEAFNAIGCGWYFGVR